MKEGIGCMLAGDADTGKVVLRDYIDATMRALRAWTSTRHAQLRQKFILPS